MKRLDQVVVGAQLHGFYRAIHHVIGAHHENDAGGVSGLDPAKHFYAVDARKHDIQQRQIGFLISEDLEPLLTGGCGKHLKSLFAQTAADGAQGQFFIVNNQDRVGHKN